MIKKWLKLLIPSSFKEDLRDKLGVPSQRTSLARLKTLGFNPKQCLDIGAYEGTWTADLKKIFPQCAVLMVEGQREKEPILKRVEAVYKDVTPVIALLGATTSVVSFNKYETASSVLTENNITNAEVEERQMELLDDITLHHKFKPDFIKIDTQGYELEVLKGGDQTLAHAEVVLLEVSFIDIYVNCPPALDVFNYMNSKGFVIYDICTVMRRPLDNALYQADILFVKAGSRLRADKRWI